MSQESPTTMTPRENEPQKPDENRFGEQDLYNLSKVMKDFESSATEGNSSKKELGSSQGENSGMVDLGELLWPGDAGVTIERVDRDSSPASSKEIKEGQDIPDFAPGFAEYVKAQGENKGETTPTEPVGPKVEISGDPTGPVGPKADFIEPGATKEEPTGPAGSKVENINPSAAKGPEQGGAGFASFMETPREMKGGAGAERGGLSDKNKEIFAGMSEGGKSIARKIYEGIYKVPGLNRLVARMEIASRGVFVDYHEKKMAKWRGKIDEIDIKIAKIDGEERGKILAAMKDFSNHDSLEYKTLELGLRKLDEKKAKLLGGGIRRQDENKLWSVGLFPGRDYYQDQFESNKNSAISWTRGVHGVADMIIEHHNKRIDPMERELSRLDSRKAQEDMLIAVAEAKFKDGLAKIDELEKTKNRLEEGLGASGKAEKEISKHPGIVKLEKQLAEERANIAQQKKRFAQKRVEIEEEIRKVEDRVNPHRSVRDTFARVKQSKPWALDVKTRKRVRVTEGTEEIRSRTRQEEDDAVANGEKTKKEERPTDLGESKEQEPAIEQATENKSEKREGTMEVSEYVTEWNQHMQREYGDDGKKYFLNLESFLESTKMKEDMSIDLDSFEDILGAYSNYKKYPAKIFSEEIDKFIEVMKKKIKEGK